MPREFRRSVKTNKTGRTVKAARRRDKARSKAAEAAPAKPADRGEPVPSVVADPIEEMAPAVQAEAAVIELPDFMESEAPAPLPGEPQAIGSRPPTPDPYERHGFYSISPSFLNMAIENLSYQLMRSLLKFPDDPGPNLWMGNAAEAAITMAAAQRTASDDVLVKRAMEMFEANAQGVSDEETDRIRKAIPDIVLTGASAARAMPRPVEFQRRVSLKIEGIGVPLRGRIDIWHQDETWTEIKCSARNLPEAIKPAHGRQGAFYAKATGCLGHILAVKPGDAAAFAITAEQVETYFAQLAMVAHAVKRILSVSSDPYEVLQHTVPNFDHWAWDDNAKAIAQGVWQ